MDLKRAALLVRVAETTAEQAEGVLQQALYRRMQLEAQIAALISRHDGLRTEAADALHAAHTEAWTLALAQAGFVDQSLQRLVAQRAEVEGAVAQARSALLEARRKLEQMLSLQQKTVDQHNGEMSLREQKAADEQFLIKQRRRERHSLKRS